MGKAIRGPMHSFGFGTRVLRDLSEHPRALASLCLGLGLSGIGHGALAIAAGLLTRSLALPQGANVQGFSVLEICYLGLAATTVKAAGSTLLAHCQAKTAGEAAMRLRQEFVSEWARAGLPDAQPRVLAMVAVRLAEFEAAVAHGALGVARALAQLVPVVLGLIFVSRELALVGTLVLVPASLGLAALRRRFRRASVEAQERAEGLHQGVDELVSHIDLWRTYGAMQRVARALEISGALAVRATARIEASRALLSGANEALAALALVGCVALAERSGLPLGDGRLVAFAAVSFLSYRPVRDLGEARAWLERGRVAWEALSRTAQPAEISTVASVPSVARFELGTLELTQVGAADRGPRTSLRLEAGASLALVGPTGSGKTTLLRVLLGLEAATGHVRFGARELTHAGLGPGQRPFAWVPQDAPLVTGTVAENVALSTGDLARARDALRELGADALLARADPIVGPGGAPLSGGERRLVALARALSSELPVLLLDEPTEGLDGESQTRVLRAIRGLAGRRSIVLVTHRREVAELCDQIVPVGSPSLPSLAAE